jgi:hypothetical protein
VGVKLGAYERGSSLDLMNVHPSYHVSGVSRSTCALK